MMRRIIWWSVGFFVLSILASFATGWPWIAIYNNWKVSRYAASIRKLPLPPKSRILAESSRFGLLFGHGNHCDVEVTFLIEGQHTTDAQMLTALKRKTTLAFPFESRGQVVPLRHLQLFIWKNGKAYTITEQKKKIVRVRPKFTNHNEDMIQGMVTRHKLTKKRLYVLQGVTQAAFGISMFDLRCR